MATAGPAHDDRVLRSIDENLAAFGLFMSRSEGRSGGSPIPDPATVFSVGAAGHGIWTRGHADAALEAVLPGAGFTRVVDLPVMVLTESQGAPRPLGAGVKVRAVEIRALADVAGVGTFRIADLDVFAGTDQERVAVEALLGGSAPVMAPEVAAFVADIDGVPAAVAISFTHGKVCRVAWVGTVPRYRRRGLGAAVTVAAVHAGFDLGARCAVLEASAMGESVYRSMGFREITRYRVWLAG